MADKSILLTDEERATLHRLCDWGIRKTDSPNREYADQHKALLTRIMVKMA